MCRSLVTGLGLAGLLPQDTNQLANLVMQLSLLATRAVIGALGVARPLVRLALLPPQKFIKFCSTYF